MKAKESGKVSRLFGKWNRRFMHFDLVMMKLWYIAKPGAKDKKFLPLNVSFNPH
jgi:hypothetical protein